MVKAETIHQTFKQVGNSCALASYAVAFHHYTDKDPREAFSAFCRHFKRTGIEYPKTEQEAIRLLDNGGPRGQSVAEGKGGHSGLIAELHNGSPDPDFVMARSRFAVTFVRDIVGQEAYIRQVLRDEDALLVMGYSGGGIHVVTVFDDGTGLKVRDTNHEGISPLPVLNARGAVRDGLLCVSRDVK